MIVRNRSASECESDISNFVAVTPRRMWRWLQLARHATHYAKWLPASIVDYLLLPYRVSRCEVAPSQCDWLDGKRSQALKRWMASLSATTDKGEKIESREREASVPINAMRPEVWSSPNVVRDYRKYISHQREIFLPASLSPSSSVYFSYVRRRLTPRFVSLRNCNYLVIVIRRWVAISLMRYILMIPWEVFGIEDFLANIYRFTN